MAWYLVKYSDNFTFTYNSMNMAVMPTSETIVTLATRGVGY